MRFLFFSSVLINCKADIWYGDSKIAQVLNQAGVYGRAENHGTRKMFDNDPYTIWHSDDVFKYRPKIIGIEFKHSMTFNSLTIQKRQDCCQDRYNNVCLVLDGDVENQICTATKFGFGGMDEQNIKWTNKKQDVKIVELVFRETGDRGHAQIADLKIDYTPSLVWHGEKSIAEVNNWAGTFDGRFSQYHMFDSDPYTSWHSAGGFYPNTKIMEIVFSEDIRFIELTIAKRQDCCKDRYENVCLVLDGELSFNGIKDTSLCTDSVEGFSKIRDRWDKISNQLHYYDHTNEEMRHYDLNHITWKKPTEKVRSVQLYFPPNSHAQIAELEIVYEKIDPCIEAQATLTKQGDAFHETCGPICGKSEHWTECDNCSEDTCGEQMVCASCIPGASPASCCMVKKRCVCDDGYTRYKDSRFPDELNMCIKKSKCNPE